MPSKVTVVVRFVLTTLNSSGHVIVGGVLSEKMMDNYKYHLCTWRQNVIDCDEVITLVEEEKKG